MYSITCILFIRSLIRYHRLIIQQWVLLLPWLLSIMSLLLYQINYSSFEKNFYEEHDDIKKLLKNELKKLRDKMGIKVRTYKYTDYVN